MEILLWPTGRAVIDLVKSADVKTSEGVMARKRLIFPGKRRLKKWAVSASGKADASADHTPDNTETNDITIELGQAFQGAKDREHLAPTNARERFGNGIMRISGVIGSQESAFGFRVACATSSIGIVAYLEQTQRLFVEQRLPPLGDDHGCNWDDHHRRRRGFLASLAALQTPVCNARFLILAH